MTLATIEVVRPTTISGLATVADLASVVAVAGVVGWLAGLASAAAGRPVSARAMQGVRRTAVVATVVAFPMRAWSVLDAVGDLALTLSSRRVLAQGLLVVLVLALALVQQDRVPLRDAERRLTTVVLGVLWVAAAVLAGPRADGMTALATTAAVVALAFGVAVGAHALLRRRQAPDGAAWVGAVGVLLAVATVAWPAVVVPTGSTSFSDELALGEEAEVLLTFAPAQPGSNEAHVYVFGPDGALLPVESVRLRVDEEPPVELLTAGPGHLVALALPFGDADSWAVDLEATMLDGRTITTRTEVPRGG